MDDDDDEDDDEDQQLQPMGDTMIHVLIFLQLAEILYLRIRERNTEIKYIDLIVYY